MDPRAEVERALGAFHRGEAPLTTLDGSSASALIDEALQGLELLRHLNAVLNPSLFNPTRWGSFCAGLGLDSRYHSDPVFQFVQAGGVLPYRKEPQPAGDRWTQQRELDGLSVNPSYFSGGALRFRADNQRSPQGLFRVERADLEQLTSPEGVLHGSLSCWLHSRADDQGSALYHAAVGFTDEGEETRIDARVYLRFEQDAVSAMGLGATLAGHHLPLWLEQEAGEQAGCRLSGVGPGGQVLWWSASYDAAGMGALKDETGATRCRLQLRSAR